jgi:hypothetical protein
LHAKAVQPVGNTGLEDLPKPSRSIAYSFLHALPIGSNIFTNVAIAEANPCSTTTVDPWDSPISPEETNSNVLINSLHRCLSSGLLFCRETGYTLNGTDR